MKILHHGWNIRNGNNNKFVKQIQQKIFFF